MGVVMAGDGLLGYGELAELLGKSVGAVRNMRLRGQLPEPDAPGPRWRRETLAGLLDSGAPVPAAGPSRRRAAAAGLHDDVRALRAAPDGTRRVVGCRLCRVGRGGAGRLPAPGGGAQAALVGDDVRGVRQAGPGVGARRPVVRPAPVLRPGPQPPP